MKPLKRTRPALKKAITPLHWALIFARFCFRCLSFRYQFSHPNLKSSFMSHTFFKLDSNFHPPKKQKEKKQMYILKYMSKAVNKIFISVITITMVENEIIQISYRYSKRTNLSKWCLSFPITDFNCTRHFLYTPSIK